MALKQAELPSALRWACYGPGSPTFRRWLRPRRGWNAGAGNAGREVDPLDDGALIEVARQARERAYVPYSRFPVGAALIAADGTVYAGCNVENASYGLCNCAERSAIFTAVSGGHRSFTQIAVIADTPVPCSPCGACRQVMSEFAPDARVILANLRGEVQVTTVRELLPRPFDEGHLPARR